jgi:cytochrome P450
MSALFVHNSETIFKDAKTFNPDRWLDPDSASVDKWLVSFSKGPRSCLGIK